MPAKAFGPSEMDQSTSHNLHELHLH